MKAFSKNYRELLILTTPYNFQKTLSFTIAILIYIFVLYKYFFVSFRFELFLLDSIKYVLKYSLTVARLCDLIQLYICSRLSSAYIFKLAHILFRIIIYFNTYFIESNRNNSKRKETKKYLYKTKIYIKIAIVNLQVHMLQLLSFCLGNFYQP